MTIWCIRVACWMPSAKNTLTICNIYWFPTAPTVRRMRLSVTLYGFCLSSLNYWQRY